MIKNNNILRFSAVALLCFSVSHTYAENYFDLLRSERVVSSEALDWRQFGPGTSGYCEEVWCHPTDPNTILMGPDMHVSYGSWDRGESWHTIKDCDGMGYDMERVIEVAFSHQDPDYGLAIDRDGNVNISTDRGRSWKAVVDLGLCHNELAVDPTNDNIWYIGAGNFFNIKDNHRSLENPNGLILRNAEYGFIWKSVDRGMTWRKITNGLPEGLDVGKIIVDPRDPNIIVMMSGHGIYRSVDQGESWSLSGAGLPNNLPRDMDSYYDAKSGEYILYTVDHSAYEDDGDGSTKVVGGVYKSLDGGVNWVDITGNLAIDLTQITSDITASSYFKAIAYWLGITPEEAEVKYPKLPTSTYTVFNRLRVNPKNKDEIYIAPNMRMDYGFPPSDVWKSSDGGKSWIAAARTGKYWIESRDREYWESRNNPIGVNTKYAHLQSSFDEREEIYLGNRVMAIDVNGDLYIEIGQQLLRSTDGAESWQQIDDNETEPGSKAWVGRGGSDLPGRFMLLETGVKGRQLFCSGEHGLWENAPLGSYPDKTAIAVKQIDGQCFPGNKGAVSISTVAVHPNDPNTIYTLVFRQEHRGALRVSRDGGKSWSDLSMPIPYEFPNMWGYHIYQSSLLIDPKNPDNIFFGLVRNSVTEVGEGGHYKEFDEYGLYKSYDGGLTWSHDNPEFPEGCSVNRLAMDPQNSSTVYAALNRAGRVMGGLYVSHDSCKSWEKMTIPEAIESVNNIYVDRNNGYLYMSTGNKQEDNPQGGGAWRSKDKGETWELIFDMPYIWQVETSPVNPDIITVNSAGKRPKSVKTPILNPGAYVSFDGGESWEKINRGLGQPDKIVDFKPDPYDESVFWCALWGSGWYKGVYTK